MNPFHWNNPPFHWNNPFHTKPNSIVLLGDSITERNYVAAGTVSQTTATDRRGWFTKLNILMHQRFNILNYAGVGAEESGEILARFAADVLAYNPSYVWIQAGANDITAATTSATTWTNIKSMIDQSIGAGIVPIVATVLPRGTVKTLVPSGLTTGAMTALTQAQLTKLNEINESIRNYSYNNSGFIFINWDSAFLADDSNANATSGLPQALYTGDGVHPNSLGATKLADFCFDILDPIIPKNVGRMSVNTAANIASGDMNNCIENGLMLGTTGTEVAPSSGVTADSWRLVKEGGSIEGVGSKVARTDGISGEWQRVTVTASADTGDLLRLDQASVSLSDMATASGWAAGDTIIFEAEVVASASVGHITHCGIELSITAPTSENHQAQFYNDSLDTTDSAISGILRTPPITIPAGASNFVPQLEMATTVGATAQFDWCRVRCFKLS